MNSAHDSVHEQCPKQCTESRLGWVHRVHTLNPSCTPTARALRLGRAHNVHWAPCRGVHWAVSWPPPRPYRGRARPCRCPHARTGVPCRSTVLRPSVMIQNCIATLTPAARHVAPAAARVAGRWASYRSHVAHCVVTQGRPPATIQCLYRDSPTSQAARERCHTPLRASRQCRGPCWSCRRAVSWPYHAVSWFATTRPCAPAARPCALAARPCALAAHPHAPAACPGLPPRRCLSSPMS